MTKSIEEKGTAFVEQLLILQLCPGQVVVMDNLKAHKAARIREAIEVALALELPHHHLRDAVTGSRTGATVPRPNELRDEQKN